MHHVLTLEEESKGSDRCGFVVFGSDVLGSVCLLSQDGNLAYGTILGTPAEVCYFGSNVTNLEKCVKEFLDFVEVRITCWKEKKMVLRIKLQISEELINSNRL